MTKEKSTKDKNENEQKNTKDEPNIAVSKKKCSIGQGKKIKKRN